jgi:hypothetical protein
MERLWKTTKNLSSEHESNQVPPELKSRALCTLKYTVFNTTLSFYFLFCLRHISAALGHHQVFCCQSCLTVIYIYNVNVLLDVRTCIICLMHLKMYVTFIKFLKTLFLLKRPCTIILGCHPLVQSM